MFYAPVERRAGHGTRRGGLRIISTVIFTAARPGLDRQTGGARHQYQDISIIITE